MLLYFLGATQVADKHVQALRAAAVIPAPGRVLRFFDFVAQTLFFQEGLHSRSGRVLHIVGFTARGTFRAGSAGWRKRSFALLRKGVWCGAREAHRQARSATHPCWYIHCDDTFGRAA